jgi:hypothetical protein
VLNEFDFLWPQEVVGVELEIVEVLLSEAFAWGEFGQMSWQRRKQEKGVFRDASNDAVLFRKGGRDRSDLLVNTLVFEGEGGWVSWQKWWEWLLHNNLGEQGRQRW